MALKGITLGPRSRVLEAKEAKERDLGDRVLGGLLQQEALDSVLYPPTPGPAVPGSPTSIRSCGCGKVNVTSGDVDMDGVTHRYSKPCYRADAEGVRTYYDFTTYRSLEARVADLERVLADVVRRLG